VNNDTAAIGGALISRKNPRTQAEMLRELLKDLEFRISRMRESNPQEALQILILLDQAVESLTKLHQVGGGIESEVSYFNTIKALFYSKRRIFISRIGGVAPLVKARQESQPPTDHWWWFIDQSLARERRLLFQRVLAISGIIVLLLAGLFVMYQRFWRPDPAFQASVGLQTTAENLLLEGRYEEAFIDVNKALALTPDNLNLLLMRGVIYDILDQPELAAEDFELAWEGYPSADIFFSDRAKYYLMAAQPELALADTETAIELNSNLTSAFLRKAQAYEALGDYSMALKYYELASEVAERMGNPQLQVIARMSMGQLLQSVPPSTTGPEN
jgi:tetratricopeptide (TPR) repeat protein